MKQIQQGGSHELYKSRRNPAGGANPSDTGYADGVYIYIPRKPGTRHAWGQKTDYKAELIIRNEHIRIDHASGESVTALSRKYHLSEKSIRRILQKNKH